MTFLRLLLEEQYKNLACSVVELVNGSKKKKKSREVP